MRNTKSKYAQMFDSTCKGWEKDRRYNLMYLKAQEHYFNEVLRARRYVFLRDILEHLGLPVTKASLFVGWYFDLNDPSGDNYIDFCLPKTNRGNTANVAIDFNVDGDITNRFKD